MECILVGGLAAEELHAVAALDQAPSFREESLEPDRPHLGAILYTFALLLRLCVAVEIALETLDCAVEDVDDRLQQPLEDQGEERVRECVSEYKEDVADECGDHLVFGRRSPIDLASVRPVAVEASCGDDIVEGP